MLKFKCKAYAYNKGKQQSIYVGLPIASCQEFFTQVVIPDVERLRREQTLVAAFDASKAVADVREWFHYDRHPNEPNQIPKFKNDPASSVPEVVWTLDLAEFAKHRGLCRSKVYVQELYQEHGEWWIAVKNVPDGQPGNVSAFKLIDVLDRVMNYWKSRGLT